VVINSFNQARYLEETVTSVVAQRSQIHQIIAIDGGSTDGSVPILQRWSQYFDYCHSRPDNGQADAIRQGFSRATGDFLYWINSDDVLLPGAIERVRSVLAKDPSLDAITGWQVFINEQSRITRVRRVPAESPHWFWWGIEHVSQPACFFRRATYEEVGGLDPSLHCTLDTDLWHRMLAANKHWGQARGFLCAFRRHPLAKGSRLLDEYQRELRLLAERTPQLRRFNPRQMAGLAAYRTQQTISGQFLRDHILSVRWRGRLLGEVFPFQKSPRNE